MSAANAPVITTPPAPTARFGASRWTSRLATAGVALAVIALLLVGLAVSPQFATATNLVNMLRAVALLAIVAAGVVPVTFGGQYADLSVPSIMAVAGATTIAAQGLGFWPSLGAGLATGTLVGVVNGAAIGGLRVNPIIWTLASGSLVNGVLRWRFGGTQIYPDATADAGRRFLALYDATLPGGVPLVLAIALLAIVATQLLLVRTTLGARLRLTGAAREAARLSGVPVGRTIALAFAWSALLASVGGILLTSLNKVGAAYIGTGYDFTAVTAIVLGGVPLAGGRGSAIGVAGGVLVIGLMGNILTLLGVGSFAQVVIQGAVFIAVVGVQQWTLRRAGRDDA